MKQFSKLELGAICGKGYGSSPLDILENYLLAFGEGEDAEQLML